jgi:FkbM family methyltransferase
MINRIIRGVFRRLGYSKIKQSEVIQESAKQKWWKSLNIDFVLDIGASDGGFARKIKSSYPSAELHSFEALPNSYERLVNQCSEFVNFHPVNVALSDKAGEIEFFLCENNTGSSSMLEMADVHKEAYPHTAKNKSIKVKAITLDEYINVNNLDLSSKTALMKLDVQGAEKIVLDGSVNTLKNVNYIFCEINFVETYKGCVLFPELNRILENQGFAMIGVENISHNPIDGTFLQADVFYIKQL